MEVKWPMRKSEAFEYHDKKVNWKMVIPIEVGFLFPLSIIIQKVKNFCFMHDLNVEVTKTGFLVRNVTFLIKGKTTESDAYTYRDALRNYFVCLENM